MAPGAEVCTGFPQLSKAVSELLKAVPELSRAVPELSIDGDRFPIFTLRPPKRGLQRPGPTHDWLMIDADAVTIDAERRTIA